MAEVFEESVVSRGRAKAASSVAEEAGLQQRFIERARHHAAPAAWSTSLGAKDLACLMAVIEQQLIPTLLRSYRPAERTPLNGSGLA